ncbi:MAG: Short-chain dehydrogenase/reductase [Candidatus Gottesmanbacteria bacterium GW2011_GWC2_39_8]|uniref:Short-chain dehydrogenase/reductase n=1 Tax=Candidatus Gottesmanbacteria bacterium GW2011_GWC2_39_8 TaxID=1618450 RepID=A0A0G0T7L8_9BACT|nr:MAG: Short-chain dehydrogenase/reductase [Candidatus Gottesmanbacteria bacterium GW2011_GWC2_39_8]
MQELTVKIHILQTQTHYKKVKMDTLKDKVVYITGAGRGLGESIARVLSKEGAIIVGVDIRDKLLNGVMKALKDDNKEALAIKIDVTNEKQIKDSILQVTDAYGGIDILINNAGVDFTMPIEELTVSDWDRAVSVNLRAPFILSKYILPVMKKSGNGHIVNVTSTAAKRTWANASAYHATKWGLLGLSHALHVEARPYNVKVTAIVAGGMRTPFLLDRFPDLDVNNLQDPKNVAETIKFVLLQPDETVIPEVMVLPMRETSWP